MVVAVAPQFPSSVDDAVVVVAAVDQPRPHDFLVVVETGDPARTPAEEQRVRGLAALQEAVAQRVPDHRAGVRNAHRECLDPLLLQQHWRARLALAVRPPAHQAAVRVRGAGVRAARSDLQVVRLQQRRRDVQLVQFVAALAADRWQP